MMENAWKCWKMGNTCHQLFGWWINGLLRNLATIDWKLGNLNDMINPGVVCFQVLYGPYVIVNRGWDGQPNIDWHPWCHFSTWNNIGIGHCRFVSTWSTCDTTRFTMAVPIVTVWEWIATQVMLIHEVHGGNWLSLSRYTVDEYRITMDC